MCLEWADFLKLVAAIAAGALIGLERELADKPAGFRTNIMICLGAALFTLLSVRMAETGTVDRTRIAAQVVTGVGFLGAGAIVQFRGSVIGLTTAATIWAVASVGMAFGAGEFALGALGTVLASGVLMGLGLAEHRIEQWRTVTHFDVELDPAMHATETVERIGRELGVRVTSWTLSKTAEGLIGSVRVVGPAARLKRFQRVLMEKQAVRALKRL
jgi:putative Mg2+ transporter-C (MgtC) family protein